MYEKEAIAGGAQYDPRCQGAKVAPTATLLERVERLEMELQTRTQESLLFYEQTKNIVRKICNVIGIDG